MFRLEGGVQLVLQGFQVEFLKQGGFKKTFHKKLFTNPWLANAGMDTF